MPVKLWFIKSSYFAIITRCPLCKQTNRTLYVLESNKGKKQIACEKCLINFPIAGLKDKDGIKGE